MFRLNSGMPRALLTPAGLPLASRIWRLPLPLGFTARNCVYGRAVAKVIEGDTSMRGKIVDVEIVDAKNLTLFGRVVENAVVGK